MFIDIHICLQKAYANIHIHKISCTDNTVRIYITDHTKQLLLYIPIIELQLTAFVLNKYNTPCGLLQCSSLLYSQLVYVTKTSLSMQVNVDPQSFVLLPLCSAIASTIGLQSIAINGTDIVAGSIDLRRNIVYTRLPGSTGVVSISMYPDDSLLSDTRLCYVNNTPAYNKHIIIKHNTLSDLRVLTKGNIQLVGVADVN